MNSATVKNMLLTLAVLVVTVTVSCDLSVPTNTGRSVEVLLDRVDGSTLRGSGAAGNTDLQWAKIRVINDSGVQVGQGMIEQVDGKLAFSKVITGLPDGTLDFMVWTGSTFGDADTVLGFGGATQFITDDTSITIPVGTATGGRKGPATGGIIFNVTKSDMGIKTGWTYLEAAPNDQGYGMEWSNITTGIGTDAQGTTVGTGQANTTTILVQNTFVNPDIGICTSGAAFFCDSLVLGGYNDWFLPSKDELNAMYRKKADIGGFAPAWYWTSSESYTYYAWLQNFSDGTQEHSCKAGSGDVRAVRVF